jgi:hypothetical protein
MLSRKSVCLACAVAVLTCLMAGAAFAQNRDKRTFFTFTEPVRMPGITLGSGTYLFRLADVTDRNVVQVLNADGSQLYGTFFAIPASRPTTPEKPEVRFMETPASTAPPIHTWWYPGDTTGFEFIYPKKEALLMAKSARLPVLTTQSSTTTTAQTETRELSRVSSSGDETRVDAAGKPVSAAPSGASQQGTMAPATLVLPSNPAPVKAEPAPTVK